ncbi:MAG TPA: hypothetical protein VEG26_12915 [Steroidobacteraceae bacterium]|nr:hypothetical protein [Steroidobacteraceae bacterium]
MRRLASVLDTLESFYGKQTAGWPTDPFLFLVWWHCGYPPSEERCNRGWEALRAAVTLTPTALAAARSATLARVLKAGGLVPQLRAARLNGIARSVHADFADDLHAALGRVPEAVARKALRKFPGIGAPGADRILLFGGVVPVAAVPSSCPHVLVRIQSGREGPKYTATYRQAQRMIEAQLPATLAARRRAYLLLQRHGRQLCKLKSPSCGECPVSGSCAYFARLARGAAAREPRARGR